MKEPDVESDLAVTRRGLLRGAAAGTALSLSAPAAAVPQAKAAASNTQYVTINLDVNGREYARQVDSRTTLLDALREELGLTGTKKGCDHGQCGACTVHLAGRPVASCLTLAAAVGAQPVTTIEGVASPLGPLHPMQAAFVKHDAFQCGYCTPGQIMAAIGAVNAGQASTPADIREVMSGNLCRCAAYPNIVEAVREAAISMGKSG